MSTVPLISPPFLRPDADEALSLSERATADIRELIVTLELAPGSPVSERELMERLGLGRTPVREALRTLAQEKLVEVYPRRGIIVSPVDVGDLASLSEVRITLESFAAHQAAKRANVGDREVARSLLSELPRVAAADDERALIELDQRLHRHVYRCAHNPYLESTLNEYYTLTLRIWFLALDRVARLDDAVTEHGEILQAIIDGDAGRAEGVMRRHIEGFERAIRAVL
ncbi:MAG: GntR family transcriptional regulator [Thermoleophilia bacterium]